MSESLRVVSGPQYRTGVTAAGERLARPQRYSSKLALVLPGGGARAAYQVGVLAALAERLPDLEFPILTGVSAGAINTIYLAAHPGQLAQAVAGLQVAWGRLTTDQVFRVRPGSLVGAAARWFLASLLGRRTGPTPARGVLDTQPLREFLEATVASSGADIGMATDPDADRLALVDETGHAIGEDFTLAFAAELVLRHRKGPVVTNLSTSRLLEDVAARAGVTLERAAVGEINVARRMEAVGAVVGGEGNGGVILPDVQLTRDSAVAAALVLQLMLETGRKLSELVAGHRRYVIVKDKLPRDAGELSAAYATLERELAAPDVDHQDGLRLAWPREARWVHLRASGTEPILRIIAEAPSGDDARELVEQARRALGVGG